MGGNNWTITPETPVAALNLPQLGKNYYFNDSFSIVLHNPHYSCFKLVVKEDHYLNQLNQTKIFYRNTPNIFTAEQGIRLVHQGDFAFHTESITAYPLIADTFEQESVCNLAEIALINSDASLMAQKRGQYKKLFQIR